MKKPRPGRSPAQVEPGDPDFFRLLSQHGGTAWLEDTGIYRFLNYSSGPDPMAQMLVFKALTEDCDLKTLLAQAERAALEVYAEYAEPKLAAQARRLLRDPHETALAERAGRLLRDPYEAEILALIRALLVEPHKAELAERARQFLQRTGRSTLGVSQLPLPDNAPPIAYDARRLLLEVKNLRDWLTEGNAHNVALAAYRIGYLVDRLSVRPHERNAQAGKRQKKRSEKGIDTIHGSPAERAKRDAEYRATFTALQREHPEWSDRQCDREAAQRCGVCRKTIFNHTGDLRRERKGIRSKSVRTKTLSPHTTNPRPSRRK